MQRWLSIIQFIPCNRAIWSWRMCRGRRDQQWWRQNPFQPWVTKPSWWCWRCLFCPGSSDQNPSWPSWTQLWNPPRDTVGWPARSLVNLLGIKNPTLPPCPVELLRSLGISQIPDVEESLLVCCYRWHPSPRQMPGESWGYRRWSPRQRGSRWGDRARTWCWRTGYRASLAMIAGAEEAGRQ